MRSTLRIVDAFIRCNNRAKITSRSYYTKNQDKSNLYSKISPLGNPSFKLTPELDDWEQKGNRVRFLELQDIVLNFRKRKRFSQALEVSEWMNRRGTFTFSPTGHAIHLDLIGKVHGYSSAEKYFSSLKDQDKTHKTYGALLHCYVRQRQADKSMLHLQKMTEMGFSSTVNYNDIMSLYSNIGQNEKIPDVLTEMKKSGLSPDNLSYRICINSYGVRSNIEEMEKVLEEMESQSHITMDWNTYAVVANLYIKAGLKEKANNVLKKAEWKLDDSDGLGFNHLISLYAQLGNKDKVLRIWALERNSCRCINRDYITMLESLVKLGELEEAEKVLKNWESSGNYYDFRVPNTVIVGFTDRGLYAKAEAMLEELMEKGKTSTPNSWARLAAGYVGWGNIEKAVACMKAALCLHVENKGWTPNAKVITRILNTLSEKSSVEDVEAFVCSLKGVIPINREMYHAIIKSYIRADKEVSRILESMKADKIDENKETKMILSMKNKI